MDAIAAHIRKSEAERAHLATALRRIDAASLVDRSGLLEPALINPMSEAAVDGTIAAVDGGLLAAEFHGFDLVIARATAAIFTYEKSKLISHAYWPGPFPEPDIVAPRALDSHDFQWYAALFRLGQEISTAIEVAKKFRPAALLLDGSIMPQMSDRPAEDSPSRPLYTSLIENYKELYSVCTRQHCPLVGVIKDSRGRRFLDILENAVSPELRQGLANSNDCMLLHHVLKPGERTAAFTYSKSIREHPVLRELGDWGSQINTMYLKPTEHDRPLRLDFLDRIDDVNGLANAIYSLSRGNKSYAYPAILIEADLRAALDGREIDIIYHDIFSKTGALSSMLKLRRDCRPFR